MASSARRSSLDNNEQAGSFLAQPESLNEALSKLWRLKELVHQQQDAVDMPESEQVAARAEAIKQAIGRPLRTETLPVEMWVRISSYLGVLGQACLAFATKCFKEISW